MTFSSHFTLVTDGDEVSKNLLLLPRRPNIASVWRNVLEVILHVCLPAAFHSTIANKVTASATGRERELVKFKFTVAQAMGFLTSPGIF